LLRFRSHAQPDQFGMHAYPSGAAIGYDYGSAGSLNDVISRLDHLSQGTLTLESYAYLGLSTVVHRAHPQSGVDLTYIGTGPGDAGDQYVGLDRFGRVVDQRWLSGTLSLDRYQYAYDRNSNVTSKNNITAWHAPLVHSDFDETYSYDPLNRLVSTLHYNSSGRDQFWTMDATGNITNVNTGGVDQAHYFDTPNLIMGYDGLGLAYDSNGRTNLDERENWLIYDAWNRVVAVLHGNVSYTAELIATHAYDGMGRMISQGDGEDGGASRVDSYFAGTQDIEQRVGVGSGSNGTASTLNYFSPVYVNALMARDRDTDANGSLDERVYFASDANFNVTAVISAAGGVLQRQVYDSYGVVAFKDSAWSDQEGDEYAQQRLFQGMDFHSDIGWYFAGQSNYARWYSPTLMVWNRPDDAGFVDGPSRLAFVGGNPINLVDPTGTTWESDHILNNGGASLNELPSNPSKSQALQDYARRHIAAIGSPKIDVFQYTYTTSGDYAKNWLWGRLGSSHYACHTRTVITVRNPVLIAIPTGRTGIWVSDARIIPTKSPSVGVVVWNRTPVAEYGYLHLSLDTRIELEGSLDTSAGTPLGNMISKVKSIALSKAGAMIPGGEYAQDIWDIIDASVKDMSVVSMGQYVTGTSKVERRTMFSGPAVLNEGSEQNIKGLMARPNHYE
jgi:RHS repeat-associated protein